MCLSKVILIRFGRKISITPVSKKQGKDMSEEVFGGAFCERINMFFLFFTLAMSWPIVDKRTLEGTYFPKSEIMLSKLRPSNILFITK